MITEATAVLSTPRTTSVAEPPRRALPMLERVEEEWCTGEGVCSQEDDAG